MKLLSLCLVTPLVILMFLFLYITAPFECIGFYGNAKTNLRCLSWDPTSSTFNVSLTLACCS